MAIYEYKGKRPKTGNDCYIAESAEVIGDVTIGDGCYIGPGAKIRGDYGKIVIGDRTAVEENCVIHARPGEVCTIGNMVTVGHASVIHNAKLIDDFAVIGMAAVVSDYTNVGEWAVVGEGAVVKNGQEIPSGKIAVGIPAKVIADVTEEYKSQWTIFKKMYVELAETYEKNLKKI
jgi:carbonic anhydrase/acetyltransferase-like protein (isoleucine patch superfamily)